MQQLLRLHWYANNIIGTRLVTYQTDANGQPVNSIIVAEDVYPVERGCKPTNGSTSTLIIFSGVSSATFSISTPPSVEAMVLVL
jgi:hypothetical protein